MKIDDKEVPFTRAELSHLYMAMLAYIETMEFNLFESTLDPRNTKAYLQHQASHLAELKSLKSKLLAVKD